MTSSILKLTLYNQATLSTWPKSQDKNISWERKEFLKAFTEANKAIFFERWKSDFKARNYDYKKSAHLKKKCSIYSTLICRLVILRTTVI